MKSKQLSFVSAISFSNSLVERRVDKMKTLFKFFDGFGQIYQNEKRKLPFHINIIDELRADENAHSRILAKFLMHEDLISNEFDILKSFIGYIVENYKNKNDFRDIQVKWPTLTVEKERIDLWIRDSNYAIILENKVQNAGDQYKQLKRYIDTTREYGYKEEDIYVLYLPPTYEKEAEPQSWGRYYNTDIYRKRYLDLSFRDDILPWLKNSVLPNARVKDRLLLSSLEQYIDHLEGKFSLRTINNKMNMELQKIIKERLEITNAEPEVALEEVIKKRDEVNSALNQLKLLEESIKLDHFQKWEEKLKVDFPKEDFPNLTIISEWSSLSDNNYVGVKIKSGEGVFSLLIGYEVKYSAIYYGISTLFATDAKESGLDFGRIVEDFGFEMDVRWYGSKYCSFENAYNGLKKLIDRVGVNYQYLDN